MVFPHQEWLPLFIQHNRKTEGVKNTECVCKHIVLVSSQNP